MTSQVKHDDIDTITLLRVLIDDKWTVILTTIVFVLGAALINIARGPAQFTATSTIFPITIGQDEEYRKLNDLKLIIVQGNQNAQQEHIKAIRKSLAQGTIASNAALSAEVISELAGTETQEQIILIDLFIDELSRRNTFVEGFRKFEVIDRSLYESDYDFTIALERLASTIKIIPPINEKGLERGPSRKYWSIQFKHHDTAKWMQVLRYVEEKINLNINASLKTKVENHISSQKTIRRFKLDVLNLERSSLVREHDRKQAFQRAFLKEQADIARQIGIEKYQAWGAQNTSKSITDHQIPFFLRGYETIETELRVLQQRTEQQPFIDGMLQIEKQIDDLKNDKRVERIEEIFSLTPIAKQTGFMAASIGTDATAFVIKEHRNILLISGMIIGILVGMALVIVRRSLSQ